MGHDKSQIAEQLRLIAAKLEPLLPAARAVRDQVIAMADWMEREHKADLRNDEIANRDTDECPMCHGMRVYVDGASRSPCPRCHGWGRQPR